VFPSQAKCIITPQELGEAPHSTDSSTGTLREGHCFHRKKSDSIVLRHAIFGDGHINTERSHAERSLALAM